MEFNGKLYFAAFDSMHGRELWTFDGVHASLVADISLGNTSSNPVSCARCSIHAIFCLVGPARPWICVLCAMR